jgi:ribosomal protein L22
MVVVSLLVDEGPWRRRIRKRAGGMSGRLPNQPRFCVTLTKA